MAVERSRLEPHGQLLGLALGEGLHARPADLPRQDVRVAAQAQPARSLRPHERFVAREAEHVDVHPLHVDGQHTRALRGVHHKQHAVRVRKRAHAGKVHRVARQVRGVGADDSAGLGTEQTLKVRVVDAPLPVCGNEVQRHAALVAQAVERTEHGVVLQIGGEHMVARTDKPVDGDVQRLGRVGGEDHMVGPRAAEERRKLAARVVDRARGGQRTLVRAAGTVAEAPHRARHRVDDLRRLAKRGRSVVKIDHAHTSRPLFPDHHSTPHTV